MGGHLKSRFKDKLLRRRDSVSHSTPSSNGSSSLKHDGASSTHTQHTTQAHSLVSGGDGPSRQNSISGDGGGGEPEEFSLDCHDLNLENVFVDENDNSKIVRACSPCPIQ